MPKPSGNQANGTVFRVQKDKDFTVMAKYHLRDRLLSLKAKGLLTVILSLPDDWNYTLTGLAVLSRDSIDSVRSGHKELEAGGYITRRQLRTADGRMGGNEYLVYENPLDNPAYQPDKKVERSPPSDLPTMENPTPEKTIMENPAQLSIDRTEYEKKQISSPSLSQNPAGTEPEGVSEAAEPLPQRCNAILLAMGYTDELGASDAETLEIVRECSLDTELLAQCRIPYRFSQSQKVMQQALEIASGIRYYLRDSDKTTVRRFDTILLALSDMAVKEVYESKTEI